MHRGKDPGNAARGESQPMEAGHCSCLGHVTLGDLKGGDSQKLGQSAQGSEDTYPPRPL